MGRIKDLREKIADDKATDEEKEELKELEEEAVVETEEAKEDEKSIEAVATKLMAIMEAKQVAKDKVVEEKAETKEIGFEAEYKAMDDDKKVITWLRALRDDDKPTLKAITAITIPEMVKLKVMNVGSSADG